MSHPISIKEGDRRGMLTMLHMRPETGKKRWLCQCDCGTKKLVAHAHLVSGATKSCGCTRKKAHSAMLSTIRNPQLVGRS